MPISLHALTGKDRSSKYKRNIILLVVSQILGVIISLLLIPITLKYLGVIEYGIWITLTTLVSWFAFFDIGLGHGLRNKYAEAKTQRKDEDVKKYVSTAFFSLIIISAVIFLFIVVFSFFIDWTIVLNAPPSFRDRLRMLVLIVGGSFCIRFIVSIINTLLTADQEPSIAALIGLTGHFFSFIFVYIVTKISTGSLLLIGIALSFSQIIPLIAAFFYLFSTRYRSILPSVSDFSRNHINSIFSLGLRFFLIQITALVIFQSNNVIIAHVSGLEDVTEFNISFKYINVLSMAFSAFVNPLWSAITEAYTKNEIVWIRAVINRLSRVLILLIVVGILMVVFSPVVYKIWLQDTVVPNYTLLWLLLLYFVCFSISTLYRNFMNGVGKIALQFRVTFVQALLHVPFAIILGRLYGVVGVVFVMVLWSLINAIWEPIQFRYIMSKSAKGIWNK